MLKKFVHLTFRNIRKNLELNAIHILNRQTGLLLSTFERPNWDEYFMLQAELAKLRSNCVTRQVGAVIVRNHRQLATGYNGTHQESKIVLMEDVKDAN